MGLTVTGWSRYRTELQEDQSTHQWTLTHVDAPNDLKENMQISVSVIIPQCDDLKGFLNSRLL